MTSALRRLSAAGSVVLMTAAAVALPHSAQAAETLDQQQTTGGSPQGVHSGQTVAQTFTAGKTGNLTRVEIGLGSFASTTVPATVELRGVTPGGAPGATALASVVLAPAAVPFNNPADPSFVNVVFPAPVPVAQGSRYALVVHAGGAIAEGYAWATATSNPYAGGSYFGASESPPVTWGEGPAWDTAFKTYVDVAPSTPPTPALDPACSFRVAAKNFNVIKGTNGNDVLRGTNGRDLIFGYGGNDVIEGRGGNDVLCGGLGADSISGGRGDDRISGGPGNDRIFGNRGDDILWGNRGRDFIRGGFGDDSVNGGPARDDVRS